MLLANKDKRFEPGTTAAHAIVGLSEARDFTHVAKNRHSEGAQ